MKKKQALTRILLILGIIILVNIISIRLFTRFDLTNTRAYTLSDASKNLVRSLDDKFVVRGYFTSELPAPYNNHKRSVQDQLDDFRAYGKGNFEYEFIDPSSKPELEQEAQRYGIPPVQVQVIKNDKLQIEKAYMGLVFLYEGKQEKLPVVQALDKLEYDISSSMKKMTSKQTSKVGILTGHDEPALDKMQDFRDVLASQYEVTTVDLSGGKSIPSDIRALLVISPKKKFADWEKFLLDQYLMKGGRLGFFIDKVDANLQNQYASPLDLGIDDLLEKYGARVNTDLVRDTRCANVTISQQSGFMVFQSQIPFAYLPVASDYNPKNVLMRNLPPVMFYFVSSIDTIAHEGVRSEVLLASSNKSGRMQGAFMINPTEQMTQQMFTEQHLPLAVALEGAMKSAYAEKEVSLDSAVRSAIDPTQKIKEAVDGKVVVVGDGNFVQRETMGSRDNLVFAASLVDWLTDDVGLTSIRSRETAAKPLEEVTEGTKTLVKSLNLALPPVLVVVAGVIRWRMRAAWRKKIQMSA
jgi:gliding-associated putative ABC transporter substrate-binding component GldG